MLNLLERAAVIAITVGAGLMAARAPAKAQLPCGISCEICRTIVCDFNFLQCMITGGGESCWSPYNCCLVWCATGEGNCLE